MSAIPAVPLAPDAARITLADLLHEPGLLLGSGSAVMYQLAVWGVGKGVAVHSTTMQRPLDRLRTTPSCAYVMGLGTDEERAAIRARSRQPQSRGTRRPRSVMERP